MSVVTDIPTIRLMRAINCHKYLMFTAVDIPLIREMKVIN